MQSKFQVQMQMEMATSIFVSSARCSQVQPAKKLASQLEIRKCPESKYLVAEVHNVSVDDDARLVPLTSSIHGCFQRARLLSGQVIEDVLEYSKCTEILHKLKPKPVQEEESRPGTCACLYRACGTVWHKECRAGLAFAYILFQGFCQVRSSQC